MKGLSIVTGYPKVASNKGGIAMASVADGKAQLNYAKSLAPDTFEKILSAGAVLLLAAVVGALIKGVAEWNRVPAFVWLHLATIVVALALTPVMLLRRRGTPSHRRLGWVWAVAMLLTAAISFLIRDANKGGFSFIHILSVWTLFQVPLIVWSARTHNLRQHRSSVRGMVTGALLIAGFFTFPFNRLLGQWLFG
jgi:uncharacterized membrane protein